MSKPYLAGLLLISPWALAAGGSWSSESFGGTMTRGQQSVKSKPLHSPSPLPPGARATTVHWKIKTDGLTPSGLRIRLCNAARCVRLAGWAGEMPLPAGIAPEGPFRFEYHASEAGTLRSPLTILSNQLTVSYHSSH